jgi:glycosyltransferase involved in cell wall biosynthesis
VVRTVTFAVPGDLSTPTGGYLYDQRMIAELQRLGWEVDVVNLGEGFPWPTREQHAAAHDRLALAPPGRPMVVDGLAYGALPEWAERQSPRNPLIALVHHPLALETGLSEAQAATLRASERRALAAATRIVATSPTTAQLLAADYGAATERIVVARPGNDRATAAHGSRDGLVRLLSVGAVSKRKGFDVLIAALASLTDLPWRLTIAGDRSRDPQAAARLEVDIRCHGLEDRVAVLGAVSRPRIFELFADADVFALASRFEGYGMAYSEAIAHGLPIVGTTAGAIPETVPDGAALLVAPDNSEALALALRRVVEDPAMRSRMAAAARDAAPTLPRWEDSAKIFSGAIEAAR